MRSILIVLMIVQASAMAQLTPPLLVGYWHNWSAQAAPYISLDSIDTRYNVIPVSFAVPTSNTDMTMVFTPDRGTQQQFTQQIQRAQQRGAKVLLSVGGATASIDLTSTANRDAFATSLTNLLDLYGFDGLDIDIEHGASIVIAGGTIAAPQSVAQQHLISAIATIMQSYRHTHQRKMILTFAPETAYVQGGMSGYGSIWGGYLPIIHALRDSLDLVHVQLYNSGTMYGIDRGVYAQGTADFVVAMTEAVIKGFATAGGTFNGIPASKVAVGLPACVDAAGGGYTDSLQIWKAVQYLRGEGPKPGQYALVQQGGYPDLAGMMTWSINWDATTLNRPKYRYASIHDTLFGPPPLALPDTVRLVLPAEAAQLRAPECTLVWRRSVPDVTVYHVEVRRGTAILFSDSTRADTTYTLRNLPGEALLTWRVRARNVTGWGPWSMVRTILTMPRPNRVVLRSPENNAYLSENSVTLVWNTASPDVSTYHVIGRDQAQRIVWDTTLTDTTLRLQLAGASQFVWMVRAQNISGFGEWSMARLFHSVPYPQTVRHIAPSDASIIDSNRVLLRWTSSEPHVRSYVVRVVCTSRVRDTMFYRVNEPSVLLDSLTPDDVYTWRVQAVNVTGTSAYSVASTVQYIPRPIQVLLESPADSANVHVDSCMLTWKEVQRAKIYHLEVTHDGVSVVDDSTLPSTSALLAKVRPSDTAYMWRVRAKGITGWGPWSVYRSVVAFEPEEPTSITEIRQLDGILVAPNPAHDVLRIACDQSLCTTFTICNLLGETMLQGVLAEGGEQILSVAHLPVGWYLLKVGTYSRVVQIIR